MRIAKGGSARPALLPAVPATEAEGSVSMGAHGKEGVGNSLVAPMPALAEEAVPAGVDGSGVGMSSPGNPAVAAAGPVDDALPGSENTVETGQPLVTVKPGPTCPCLRRSRLVLIRSVFLNLC